MSPTLELERYRHLSAVGHAAGWLSMRAQFGLAPNTIDAYARSLDSYFSFAANTGIDHEKSTRGDIARWVRDLETKGLANATLIQRITALRLYFEYLVEEGVRPNSPVFRGGTIQAYGSAIFRTSGPIRRVHKLPWIPTDEEWRRVLDATSDSPLRDRTMLALAYDGALRREELCRVAVSDFDFARRLLTIRAETTKTKRGRVLPYSQTASVMLCSYLNRRHTMRTEPDVVFLSESSRNRADPISPYTWTKVVERIAERGQLPKLTTHTMRHLRLTDLARAGLDIHEIATIAGHSVLQSTQLYTHLSARDLTAAFARNMAALTMLRYPELTEGINASSGQNAFRPTSSGPEPL